GRQGLALPGARLQQAKEQREPADRLLLARAIVPQAAGQREGAAVEDEFVLRHGDQGLPELRRDVLDRESREEAGGLLLGDRAPGLGLGRGARCRLRGGLGRAALLAARQGE